MLLSGYKVIIDAANLKQQQRQRFIELAKSISVPFRILHYTASPETLRQRVKNRMENEQDASDATLEVLEHQLINHEALTEENNVVEINTELYIEINDLLKMINFNI